MNYPYFIVQRRVGRLPCPIEYRHTPIERQFKSGRIGGSKTTETTHSNATDTQRAVFDARRDNAQVTVYVVLRPQTQRHIVHNSHSRVWTLLDNHVRFEDVDSWLESQC